MEPSYESALNIWDGLAIALYFVLVLTAGLYSMRRSNRSTVAGYFLAGRHMTWLPVGASLFASNIGSEHIIGLAGSGAASGIAVGAFEFNAVILLQLLGWVFLPVYIASKVSTLPEYLTKRFGGQRLRIFLAVLSLALYILSKVSVNMYSGALFIKEAVGWNLYLSVLLLLAMTTLCTVTGGLAAVIYMDTLQFFIMIIGTAIVMIKSFQAVGGYSGLQEKYASAVPNLTIANTTCHQPLSEAWVMLRTVEDSNMPWLGFLLGQTPASIWYFCADQVMVQRALAAKSLSHAQGATLFSGYAKILPFFLIVLPGMISRVLYPDVVACVVPEECEKYCGSRLGCSNLAYPKLVLGVLPLGLRGVIMAVIMAALMSDMTSIFNSSSTLFTIDIWKNLRRSAGPKELLIVGKIFVVVMVVFSILWIPIIENTQGGQLFIFIQVITAYLTPSIAAVYLLAIFWKRINEQGAFWSLVLSFILGIARMSLDFFYQEPACGEIDERPAFIAKIHYMYFAFILFSFTAINCIIISLLTKKPDESLLIRTTYWTRTDKRDREDDQEDNEFNTAIAGSSDLPSQLEVTAFGGRASAIIDNKPCNSVSRSRWKVFYSWFCGYEMDLEHTQEKSIAFQKHLQALSSLQQTKKEKTILRINLVFIILTGIAIFVSYTLNLVDLFTFN